MGFLLKIKCLVSYDNNNNNRNNNCNGNINTQNFILPQFENDIIIDFKLIYFNLDMNRLFKTYNNKFVIFSNDNNIYYYFLNKDIKNNKEIKKLV